MDRFFTAREKQFSSQRTSFIVAAGSRVIATKPSCAAFSPPIHDVGADQNDVHLRCNEEVKHLRDG